MKKVSNGENDIDISRTLRAEIREKVLHPFCLRNFAYLNKKKNKISKVVDPRSSWVFAKMFTRLLGQLLGCHMNDTIKANDKAGINVKFIYITARYSLFFSFSPIQIID